MQITMTMQDKVVRYRRENLPQMFSYIEGWRTIAIIISALLSI